MGGLSLSAAAVVVGSVGFPLLVFGREPEKPAVPLADFLKEGEGVDRRSSAFRQTAVSRPRWAQDQGCLCQGEAEGEGEGEGEGWKFHYLSLGTLGASVLQGGNPPDLAG